MRKETKIGLLTGGLLIFYLFGNAFYTLGIKTVADLVKHDEFELIKTRGIGKKLYQN